MRKTLTVLALLAGGCGTQIGTEDGGCDVASTEAVDDLAAVPDGFTTSVQDVLDRLLGTFDGTVTHPDDSTLDVTLGIARDGDVVVERRTWDEGRGNTDVDMSADCLDAVKVPVAVTLVGAPDLDEAFAADAYVQTDGEGSLSASIALDDLGGTAAPLGFSVDDMAETDLHVYARPVDGGWDGEVTFVGTSEPSGDGPDSSVSATLDPWGDLEVRRAE